MIEDDIKIAQEEINKLTQEWEKTSKSLLQVLLDKVEGKDKE